MSRDLYQNWSRVHDISNFSLSLGILSLSCIFVSGSLWYAMAVNTSENSDTHQTIMLFESMFGPDFVIGNLYRCFAVFSFLALAMILKTVFTIGLSNTAQIFAGTDSNDAYGIVTSEGFLKGALIRAFFNSFFLIVGWGLVALLAKKKLAFFHTQGRKRRRKRSFVKLHEESQIILEYQRVISKL